MNEVASDIREAIFKTAVLAARIDERTTGIENRLEDHISGHEDTRRIVAESIAQCQRRAARGVMSGKALAGIIAAAITAAAGVVTTLLVAGCW